jgi:NarL family two-component system response regulator LiaR
MSTAREGPTRAASDRRRAVVADAEPLWIEAFAAVLEPCGFTVVGRATSLERALHYIDQHRPDLLVAGLSPHVEPGWPTLIDRMRAAVSDLTVVLVVSRDDQQLLTAASRAGVSAFVLKSADRRDLETAIRQAFEQTIFFGDTDPDELELESDALSDREIEVLRLIAAGYRNVEVARALWITDQTVKTHLAHIYRKLGVTNRTEASQWYHDHFGASESRSHR